MDNYDAPSNRIQGQAHSAAIDPRLLEDQTMDSPADSMRDMAMTSHHRSPLGNASQDDRIRSTLSSPVGNASSIGFDDGQVRLGLAGAAAMNTQQTIRSITGPPSGRRQFNSNPPSGYDSIAYQWSIPYQKVTENWGGFDAGPEVMMSSFGINNPVAVYGQLPQQQQHYPLPPLPSYQYPVPDLNIGPGDFATYGQHRKQKKHHPGPSTTPPMSSLGQPLPGNTPGGPQKMTTATRKGGTRKEHTKKERNKWTLEMDQCLSMCKMQGMTTNEIAEVMQKTFPGINTGKDSLSKRFQRIQERNLDPYAEATKKVTPVLIDIIFNEMDNGSIGNNAINVNDKNMLFHPELAVILADNPERRSQVKQGLPRALLQAVQSVVNGVRKSTLQNWSAPVSAFRSPSGHALVFNDETGEHNEGMGDVEEEEEGEEEEEEEEGEGEEDYCAGQDHVYGRGF